MGTLKGDIRNTCASHGSQPCEGRPKTPVFSFNHRRTGRSKSCQKLCARKERASAAQGTRKVTVLKGFMY